MARQRKPEAEDKDISPVDFLSKIQKAIDNQVDRPNMYAYRPHDKQLLFHASSKVVRLYIGGNRSGKSVGGVIEDLWWATGRHPYRRVPRPPIFGRVVGVDFINGIQGILMPIFKRWIVPSDLINGSWEDSFDKTERTLTLENESVIDFKSNDQDLEKHAGTSRNFIHFDEEPPKRYFEENLMRIIDVGGSVWITMTPVEGMTWTYKTLYEPGIKGTATEKGLSVDVVQVSMSDNPYLSAQEKALALAFLDEDTRAIREFGRFVPRGGLVFPKFMQSVHVLPAGWVPPKNWIIYHSLDHGYNNPTASLHHAVSPDGSAHVTFHEHYAREMTVEQHARAIIEWEINNKIEPFLRTGDPSMRQRQAQSGSSIQQLYAEEGILFALDSVPRDVGPGVDRINTYLDVNPKTGAPWWVTTEDCPNLIREMKGLHWAFYTSSKVEDANNAREQIHKKDDHAPDALRYWFTFLPDLSPEGLDMLPNKPEPLVPGDVGTIWDFINSLHSPEGEWDVRIGYDLSEVEYE